MLCKLENSNKYTELDQQHNLGQVVEIKLSAQNAAQCASILNKVRWDKLSNLQRIVIENCEFSGYEWDHQIAFSQLQEIEFINTTIDVSTANSLLNTVALAKVVVRVDQDCEYTAMQDYDESNFYSWDGGVDELKKRIASMNGSSQTTDEYSEFIDDSDNSKEDDWILSDYDEENSQDSDDNSNKLYIKVKNDNHTLSSQQSILSQQNSWDNFSSQSSTSEKNSRQFQDEGSDNDDMSSKILSEGLTGRYRDQEVMLRRRDSLSQQYDDDSLDNFSSHSAPQTGITLTVLIGEDAKTLFKEEFDSISAKERANITHLVIDGHGQSITHINVAGLTSLNTLNVIDAEILDVSEFVTDDKHDNTMFRNLTNVTINNCVVNEDGIEGFLGSKMKSLTLVNPLSDHAQKFSTDEINKLSAFVQTKVQGIRVEVTAEEEYDMDDFETESISTARSTDSRNSQYSQNSRRSGTDILLDNISSRSDDEDSQSTSRSNSQDSLSSFDLLSSSHTESRSTTKGPELTIRKTSFNDDDVSEEEQLISESGQHSFDEENQHLNTNNDLGSTYESVSRSDRSGSTHQSRLTSKNDSRMFTPLPNGSSHKTRHEGKGVSIDSQASTQSFKHAYGRRVRDEVSLCSQDNKHRSLKKIENAIGEGLDNHIGKGGPHRHNYSTVINKKENCVSLTYKSSSHKKIPVMDVSSDSLVVYRSWRENVDDSKVSIEDKAMIVLAGLGIPPYPRHGVDVEGHQDSPLVGAINRILNEMKQQKDVDDQEDIQVQFRQFKN